MNNNEDENGTDVVRKKSDEVSILRNRFFRTLSVNPAHPKIKHLQHTAFHTAKCPPKRPT